LRYAVLFGAMPNDFTVETTCAEKIASRSKIKCRGIFSRPVLRLIDPARTIVPPHKCEHERHAEREREGAQQQIRRPRRDGSPSSAHGCVACISARRERGGDRGIFEDDTPAPPISWLRTPSARITVGQSL